jgi:L-ribulose-5-phosphate 3-epimerase
MLLGYNTNGFAHHDPLDAIRVLGEIGYRSVALTLDHGRLNPFAADFADQLKRVRDELHGRQLRSVVETGARFLLDPYVKHEPTLVSSDSGRREIRLGFLRRAVDAAVLLGSDCVSLWSGIQRDEATEEEVLERLARGLKSLLDYAGERGVVLAFEPEPGMFVDTMSRFARLLQWIDEPHLRLTLDLGHLYCQGEVPIADYIARWSTRIANVHIEDMRAGVHEHLMFGEGEMQFPPILDALAHSGYRGGVHVELSRHSHEAPQAARRAYDFLEPLFRDPLN